MVHHIKKWLEKIEYLFRIHRCYRLLGSDYNKNTHDDRVFSGVLIIYGYRKYICIPNNLLILYVLTVRDIIQGHQLKLRCFEEYDQKF